MLREYYLVDVFLFQAKPQQPQKLPHKRNHKTRLYDYTSFQPQKIQPNKSQARLVSESTNFKNKTPSRKAQPIQKYSYSRFQPKTEGHPNQKTFYINIPNSKHQRTQVFPTELLLKSFSQKSPPELHPFDPIRSSQCPLRRSYWTLGG